MLEFHELCAVAFTQLVTVVPNNLHDTNKLRISTGAHWTFLADENLEVQRALDINEYTDTHHDATVPHTLVVAPGLLMDKVTSATGSGGVHHPISYETISRSYSPGSKPTSTRRPTRPGRRGRPNNEWRAETWQLGRPSRLFRRNPWSARVLAKRSLE